jgi:hypothetical protein
MTKVTLAVEPTFQAPVTIPAPGGKLDPVTFTFKYRTKDELDAYSKSMEKNVESISNVDVVMGIAEGWDLDDAFTRENVERLLQKFHAAAGVISRAYITELTQARLGN